jgi:hypothetical protein
MDRARLASGIGGANGAEVRMTGTGGSGQPQLPGTAVSTAVSLPE